MIKEFKCYSIVCDCCGKDSNENTEYGGWDNLEYAEEVAQEDGWYLIDDEAYCTNCFEYDDEDELIFKNNRNK